MQDKGKNNYDLKEWNIFISELYGRIINNDFIKGNIRFIPPLSKVEMLKLKKIITDKKRIFLRN